MSGVVLGTTGVVLVLRMIGQPGPTGQSEQGPFLAVEWFPIDPIPSFGDRHGFAV
jgi:hypothetical protein